MISTYIYKYSKTTGAFSASVMGSFNEPECIHHHQAFDVSLERITSISWCVNTVGGIELAWGGTNPVPFVLLSGNGRWELASSSITKPKDSNGLILLSAEGLDDLDTFTIIITGQVITKGTDQ